MHGEVRNLRRRTHRAPGEDGVAIDNLRVAVRTPSIQMVRHKRTALCRPGCGERWNSKKHYLAPSWPQHRHRAKTGASCFDY